MPKLHTLHITEQQAALLLEALEQLQASNCEMMVGWTLTKDVHHDVEVLTGISSVWGNVDELYTLIKNTTHSNL